MLCPAPSAQAAGRAYREQSLIQVARTQTSVVKLRKGAIKVTAAAGTTPVSVKLYSKLYEPESLMGTLLVGANETKSAYIAVPQEGQYYLRFSSSTMGSGAQVKIHPYKLGSVIELGKVQVGSSAGDNTTAAKYLFDIPERGSLRLKIISGTDSTYPFYVKILDAKKNNLSGDYVSLEETGGVLDNIVLEEGRYYLAVKTSDPVYKLKLTLTKEVHAMRGSKEDAVELIEGKTKKGEMILKGSPVWYKFTLDKAAKGLKFIFGADTFSGSDNGGLKFTLCTPDGSEAELCLTSQQKSASFDSGDNEAAAGTYYIKVSHIGTGCGTFQITVTK
ncbi:MAG: hypothetical protein ACSW8A_06405 [Lachnospiraceae bacterium]